MGRGALKVIIIVLAIVLVLWGASEIAIPRIASWYIEKEIKKEYPQATDVSVSVKAFPALKLAFKKYSRLDVRIGNVTLEGVDFVSIDMLSSAWPMGAFTAVINQDELNKFFDPANPDIGDLRLEFATNVVRAHFSVEIGPSTVDAVATGALSARNGRDVYFVPDSIKVEDFDVPESATSIISRYMNSYPVFSVREDLPFTINELKPGAGTLSVMGTVNLEKALNVKV